jgi:DNA-binding transcriptional LysR family regulator
VRASFRNASRRLAERSIERPPVYQSDRDDWVLAMIAAGLGYGILPMSLARHTGVVARPLTDPEVWRTVSLVTRRGRPHSPAVGAFVREVMRTKWLGKKALGMRATPRRRGPAD